MTAHCLVPRYEVELRKNCHPSSEGQATTHITPNGIDRHIGAHSAARPYHAGVSAPSFANPFEDNVLLRSKLRVLFGTDMQQLLMLLVLVAAMLALVALAILATPQCHSRIDTEFGGATVENVDH